MKVLASGAAGGTGRLIVRFRPRSVLNSVAHKSRLNAERFRPFKPQEEDPFNMKAEHTIDKPARAGRATQMAAMVITGLVAVIWVYFGRLYLVHDPEEWRIANQQLGYRWTEVFVNVSA